MKNICIILTCLFLTSCYTKKKAIEKFCTQDSTQVTLTIHDTLHIDSSRVDTVFSTDVDTVTIENDRLIVRYVKSGGKVHLSGTSKANTIYYTRTITKYVDTFCPKYTYWDALKEYWYWLFVAFVAGILVAIYRK